MKKCSKCKIIKEFVFFSKGANKDGYRSACKECILIQKAIYRNNNKEKIKIARKKYSDLKRKTTNKPIRKYQYIGTGKKYYELNKTEINKKKTEKDAFRRKTDPLYKFKVSVRWLIKGSFKRGKDKYIKSQKSISILGCSICFFREYIQSKFTKGMTIENHGEWHLDHIIPLSTAKNEDDVIRLNHYTNFQPLWAKDNLIKKDKIINKQLTLI